MHVVKSDRKLHPQAVKYLVDRSELWVSVLRERAIKTLSCKRGIFGKLSHSLVGAYDIAKGYQKAWYAIVECILQIPLDELRVLEILFKSLGYVFQSHFGSSPTVK